MSASYSLAANVSQSVRNELAPAPRRLPQNTTFVTALTVVGLLNGVGALIVGRRLAGALSQNLPLGMVLLTALVATAAASCTRIAWRRVFPLRQNHPLEDSRVNVWGGRLVGFGSSLALPLLAIGCCYPGSRTSEWLIWLPLLVADTFWRQSFFDSGGTLLKLAEEPDEGTEEIATIRFTDPVADKLSQAEEIVQQLFRVRDEDVGEVIYGSLRADFQPGERRAVLHVGFCPPVAHLPEIEAEPLPGFDAKVKVVQALAHGARLEVRLPTPASESTHVWIDMAARPQAGPAL